MLYKAILTDLGNTVIDFDRRRVAENLKPHCSRFSVNTIDYLVNKSEEGASLLKQFETGVINPYAYRCGIKELLGNPDIHPQKFWDTYVDLYTPNVAMIELLKFLRYEKRTVQRLVAVSDIDPIRVRRVIEIIDLPFDHMILSFNTHVLKPHEDMFRDAHTCIDALPEECIYVDDLEDNTDAGRAYGFTVFHFDRTKPNPTKLFVQELEILGFDIPRELKELAV